MQPAYAAPGFSVVTQMEARKLIVAVIAVIVLVAVVVIATNAYKAGDQKPVDIEITPTIMPEPTLEPTPVPTPEPTQVATPTPGPVTSKDGPFNMHAAINKTDGKCLLTLQLLKDSAVVDVTELSVDICCDDRTARNVWTPKPMDWCNADNDTMLEPEEIIATIIDTAARNIPQSEPVTITVYQKGEMLQALTVVPS